MATSTLTTSYLRALSDFFNEVVHVISFVPTGTAISAVSDWGPIWNKALNECRAHIKAGKTFTLVGPDCQQTISTQVNGTAVDFDNSGTPTRLISFGSIIDFGGANIIGATGGKATFDFMSSWFIRIKGLNVTGSSTTGSIPTIGFQWGRTGITSGENSQNADTIRFDDCFTNGWFSFTALYNNNSESNTFIGGWISNNCPLAQATGTPSVGGNPTGEANTCYALVNDNLNHWNVPTLMPGGQLQPTGANEANQSFEQFLCVGTTITCGAGPAMWISSGTNHEWQKCYLNSGSSVSLIDWYRYNNDGDHSFKLDVHCEYNGAGYASLIRLIGFQSQGGSNTVTGSFSFKDGGTCCAEYFMAQAFTGAPNTVVFFEDIEVEIGQVTGYNGSSPVMFNDPELFQTNGTIKVPAGTFYNGVWATPTTLYGHSGKLSINGAVVYGGNVQWAGKLQSAAVVTVLAELGLDLAADCVGSVTITGGGNYYSTSGRAAYAVSAIISPPPNSEGRQATAHVNSYSIAGLGAVTAGGNGYTNNAAGLAVEDGVGNTLPFTVSVLASGGVLKAVESVVYTGTFEEIPEGPFTVVQFGASGGTFDGTVFSCGSVEICSPGSGYQFASAAPTITFDDLFASAAATGTVFLASAITVRSLNVMAGQKIGLDSTGTMWVQEDTGGKVVVGTGTTRLFSIDASGNVLVKGTITASVNV